MAPCIKPQEHIYAQAALTEHKISKKDLSKTQNDDYKLFFSFPLPHISNSIHLIACQLISTEAMIKR